MTRRCSLPAPWTACRRGCNACSQPGALLFGSAPRQPSQPLHAGRGWAGDEARQDKGKRDEPGTFNCAHGGHHLHRCECSCGSRERGGACVVGRWCACIELSPQGIMPPAARMAHHACCILLVGAASCLPCMFAFWWPSAYLHARRAACSPCAHAAHALTHVTHLDTCAQGPSMHGGCHYFCSFCTKACAFHTHGSGPRLFLLLHDGAVCTHQRTVASVHNTPLPG